MIWLGVGIIFKNGGNDLSKDAYEDNISPRSARVFSSVTLRKFFVHSVGSARFQRASFRILRKVSEKLPRSADFPYMKSPRQDTGNSTLEACAPLPNAAFTTSNASLDYSAHLLV
jgi:hypothetical protein